MIYIVIFGKSYLFYNWYYRQKHPHDNRLFYNLLSGYRKTRKFLLCRDSKSFLF